MTLRYKTCLFAINRGRDQGINVHRVGLLSLIIRYLSSRLHNVIYSIVSSEEFFMPWIADY